MKRKFSLLSHLCLQSCQQDCQQDCQQNADLGPCPAFLKDGLGHCVMDARKERIGERHEFHTLHPDIARIIQMRVGAARGQPLGQPLNHADPGRRHLAQHEQAPPRGASTTPHSVDSGGDEAAGRPRRLALKAFKIFRGRAPCDARCPHQERWLTHGPPGWQSARPDKRTAEVHPLN